MLLIAALLVSLFPLFSPAQSASAATDTSCSTADEGSGRYASTLCWFDFSGYSATQATSSAGQDMSVSLPGGSTMTFTLKASGGQVRGNAFPTYSAAYLGNGSYTGVNGRPALYQASDRTNTDLILTDIVLTTAGGDRSNAFSLVGADAESTDGNESIVWSSSNPMYSLTANGGSAGIGNACAGGYGGLGTRTVTCTGAGSATKTGTAIVASQAPDTFSQRMVGGGRQAVAFGVLLSQIELNKQVGSRFTGDAFEVAIDDEEGARLFDATTGPTGTTATTEEQTVLATDRGATFRFSERATSGSLDRYDATWSCTRNGETDSTLPNGPGVGSAADVHLGIGDFVSCTITNAPKQTSLALQKRATVPEDVNGNGLADTGDRIGYTFDVTNTGELPVDEVAVDDPKIGAVTCPTGTLAPGATVTCTADGPYTVTADDQQNGSVDNTATASGITSGTEDVVTSNESSTTTPLTDPAPGIALTKIATPNDEASYVLGQEITYSFVVTNTGNVALESVAVAETEFSGTGDLSAIDCPATRIEPDRSMTCSATYTLTQGDIDATRVTNSAATTGTPVGGGDPVTDDDSAVIPGVANSEIGLEKSVSPRTAQNAGDTVEYTFHVINRGNLTLTDPQVTETAFTGSGDVPVITCPTGDVAPGGAVDCTATYTLTQADVDAGLVDNTATATATPPAGEPPVSPESDARVTIPATGSGLTLQKTADTETYAEVGQTITYSFEVTNTGNRTLNDVAVTDTEFSGSGELSAIDCPADSLAGNASMTCTATYEITQADIDAGSVHNEATAAGTPVGASDPIGTPPSDVTITTQREASLSLVKSADPTEASEGDEIRYTFQVTNDGNVTVANPLVDEIEFTGAGSLSDVYCPTGALAPGESVDCTASYTVVAADRDISEIENTAVATAQPPAGMERPRSNESSAQVRILNPAISLEKTANRSDLTAGDTITYSFEVTNTGNVPLDDITVTETEFSGAGDISAVACPADTPTLKPGDSVTCTATYEVTPTDVRAGAIDNTAVATGTPPVGDVVESDPSSVQITDDPVPSLGLVKRAGAVEDVNGNGLPDAGDRIAYTFDVTNTGDLPLDDITVDDPKIGAVTCEGGTLEPGGTVTCTADEPYTVTADDQEGGAVDNVATATGVDADSGDSVTSNESNTSTPLTAAAPGISLTKIATPHDAASFVVGQEITYSFVVVNTGNVALDDVTVAETTFSGTGDISAIDCPATRLETDRSMTCTATYTLTQGDIDAAQVTNSAETSGTPVGGGDAVTDDDEETIPGDPAPAIGLEKSVDPSTAQNTGDTVEYTFHVINLGNVTLNDPRVDETAFTGTGGTPAVTCPAGPLEPGTAVDCTAQYTLTQDDIDAGAVDNTAVATATPSIGDAPVSNESSARVTIPEADTGITIVKSASTETYAAAGQEVTYSFEVTNTGNRSLNDVVVTEAEFTGSGSLGAIDCPSTSIAGNSAMTCTATYEITQADLDSGDVYNAATASGVPVGETDPIGTPRSDVTITAEQQAALSLVKSADPTEAQVGDGIQYTFRVTNDGNVTLLNPVVEEVDFTGAGNLGDVTCPTGALAPGASVDCSASYTVVDADGAAGVIDNTAVATAEPPAGVDPPRSDESSATVRIIHAAIELVKTADRTGLTVGETVTYSFEVTNTGNVPLSDVTVSETQFTGAGDLSAVSCPDGAASLEPGASVTCTATYEVTQADVDAGAIDNTAVASGTPSSGDPVESDPSDVRITEDPVAGLGIVKTADVEKVTRPGQIVTYSFVLTNTGRVTLTDPTVDEQEFTGHGFLSPVTCPEDVRLLPGESVTCTATYEVVAADLTGEPLTNVATGTGVDPHGKPKTSPPDGVNITTTDRGELPNTGSDSSLMLLGAAAGLVLLGLVVATAARARRKSVG